MLKQLKQPTLTMSSLMLFRRNSCLSSWLLCTHKLWNMYAHTLLHKLAKFQNPVTCSPTCCCVCCLQASTATIQHHKSCILQHCYSIAKQVAASFVHIHTSSWPYAIVFEVVGLASWSWLWPWFWSSGMHHTLWPTWFLAQHFQPVCHAKQRLQAWPRVLIWEALCSSNAHAVELVCSNVAAWHCWTICVLRLALFRSQHQHQHHCCKHQQPCTRPQFACILELVPL